MANKFTPSNYYKMIADDLCPGSPNAIAHACKCPVIDNNYGRGDMGLFWVNETCPVHGTERDTVEMESTDG